MWKCPVGNEKIAYVKSINYELDNFFSLSCIKKNVLEKNSGKVPKNGTSKLMKLTYEEL